MNHMTVYKSEFLELESVGVGSRVLVNTCHIVAVSKSGTAHKLFTTNITLPLTETDFHSIVKLPFMFTVNQTLSLNTVMISSVQEIETPKNFITIFSTTSNHSFSVESPTSLLTSQFINGFSNSHKKVSDDYFQIASPT